MRKISARIVADSISPQGHRITSFILTYPRFIHAEVMTHRMFSRNAASSRAIPFKTMLKSVSEDPFIPIAWQKEHTGMQGTEYITDPAQIDYRIGHWMNIAKKAAQDATDLSQDMIKRFSAKDGDYEILLESGVTKQLCNRLLEPFLWYTNLVTATEFENFFELRCPNYTYKGDSYFSRKDLISSYTFATGFEEDKKFLSSLSDLDWIKMSTSGAEIHIQALAEAMWDAYNENTPNQLKPGEWHIPFGDKMELTINSPIVREEEHRIIEANAGDFSGTIPTIDYSYLINKIKLKVAIARCARLSYMTFDNEINYDKDIALYNMLLKSKHASPFEHVAKCMSKEEYDTFYKGRLSVGTEYYWPDEENQGWCNNFRGFIPYRYLIENE